MLEPRTRQIVVWTHANRLGMLTRRFTISRHPSPTNDEWKLRIYFASYVYKPTKKKEKKKEGKCKEKIDRQIIPEKQIKIDKQGIPTNKWYRRIKQDRQLSFRIEMEELSDNEDNNSIRLFIGRHGMENEALRRLIPLVKRWHMSIAPSERHNFSYSWHAFMKTSRPINHPDDSRIGGQLMRKISNLP